MILNLQQRGVELLLYVHFSSLCQFHYNLVNYSSTDATLVRLWSVRALVVAWNDSMLQFRERIGRACCSCVTAYELSLYDLIIASLHSKFLIEETSKTS
jgi:hypothetical protein